jgi:hypothetical protein
MQGRNTAHPRNGVSNDAIVTQVYVYILYTIFREIERGLGLQTFLFNM